MAVIYVPRVFGGTLILNVTTITQPVTSVIRSNSTLKTRGSSTLEIRSNSTLKTRSGSILKERG